jgi:hypothetical protein
MVYKEPFVKQKRRQMSAISHIDSRLIDDHFVEAGLDEPSGEMLDLLSCLYEKIASSRWESNGDSLSGVTRPDMKTGISRSTVDSETVEIGMKTCQDGILRAIFPEI